MQSNQRWPTRPGGLPPPLETGPLLIPSPLTESNYIVQDPDPASGISDAPSDGTLYGRKIGEWDSVPESLATDPSGILISTPGNIGWNQGGNPQPAPFSILGGPNGQGIVPAPTFYPKAQNTSIAFDICPNGTPTDFGYGLAWFDMTPTDQVQFGDLPVPTFHIAAHSNSCFLGSGKYTGAAIPPLNFGTFDGDAATETTSFTINPDASVTFKNKTTFAAIQKSGLPAASDISAGYFGMFKDTAGGGVYLAYNDAGTIKKVALT
jgi:hypothetical protein